MQVTSGNHTFSWNSDWAKVPESIQPGYTHGVAVDADGMVHVFNQSEHGVLRFEPDGKFAGTWDEFPSDRFVGAHGLTLVDNGGEQFFWLTDQRSAEVVKTTLDGRTVMKIDKPDHAAYREGGKYAPTWAAEAPDGTVFVADGYGSSLVSCYDKAGNYLATLDGEDGEGRFKCPHGIWITRRPAATGVDDHVLYITDRGNRRVQVFTLDGKFLKSFEQQHPCSFGEYNGELLVPDLHAFINIYNEKDELVAGHLGDQREIVGQHGWPNVPMEMRVPGKFNSPHGGCYDHDGNIYIVEWVQEGRITKLTRV